MKAALLLGGSGLAVLGVLGSSALRQDPQTFVLNDSNSFPFVIPWNDVLRGTATDVSFLNIKPAGKNGFIVARNGRFYEEKTGKRVRFFGTNLGAKAAFPLKEEAPLIAAHLAKMGINIVRFHHLQNDWDREYGMIWKKGREQIELDPVQVDKLDYFIAELKKQGIYVNMNLQTTRKMIPALGFPESVTQVPNFTKKLDKLNEKMIALQQDYARQLLGRTNPYTGLKYKDDPALMVIEINNENSLVGWPGEQPGQGLEKWPEPFLTELKSKWNAWLKARYKTQSALDQAWPSRDTREGPSLTTPQTKWTWENHSNGDVVFEALPATGQSASELHTIVRSNPGPAWHVQAHLPGLNLVNGKTYTVEFEGKADRSLAVNIDARLDVSDWRFLGLGGSASLTPEWKRYALSFTATDSVPDHARIGFVLGDIRGELWVRGLTLREGSLEKGLEPGESLDKGNIAIPTAGKSKRYLDYARFLVETEARYTKTMRDFLRGKLGFTKANIIDTQIAWGGLTSLVRESDSEFADAHQYWNHPTFLGSDWDPKNYRVERRALVNERSGGTLQDLATWRVVEKPYAISEYNHPAPSDFQCEMMPMYAAAAALQDWDIIYTFAWEATGKREVDDRYDGYFDFARNPAKKAFFPAAALIFRQGLLDPLNAARQPKADERTWERTMFASSLYSKPAERPMLLDWRLGLRISNQEPQTSTKPETTTRRWIGPEGKKVLIVESPKSVVISGYVGGTAVNTSVGEFRFGRTPTDFASLMLVPLDGKPLKSSARILLTVLGRVENPGMGWNAARDSVSDRWGTGPTRAEAVPVTVNLTGLSAAKAFSLDPSGKQIGQVSQSAGGKLALAIGPQTRSAWYEILR